MPSGNLKKYWGFNTMNAVESVIGKKSDTERKDDKQVAPEFIFVLPLQNMVTFPNMMMPLVVVPESHSYAAIKKLIEDDELNLIGLFAKKNFAQKDKPTAEDFHHIGVTARVLKLVNLPDGGISLFIQTIQRVQISEFVRETPYFAAKIQHLVDQEMGNNPANVALYRTVKESIKEVLSYNPALRDELGIAIANIESPAHLTDFIGAHFRMENKDRQALLETLSVEVRLNMVLEHLSRELNILQIGKKIKDEIQSKVSKVQREYFLKEELKAIKKELGQEKEDKVVDLERYEKLIQELKMPKVAEEKAQEELQRLSVLMPESAEYNVLRTYLDWMVSLPWSKGTHDNNDLLNAQKILDEDHYGLKKVKERVLEFLSVRQLQTEHQGPILCLAGPPGVGKTSLGRSIAKSLGREFFRFSLGGMRDEAEIKGHRRTYIGAMPGKFIQALKKCKTNNPVILLDEIDKIGTDFRGDPASALLEVLDPEQNKNFLDHYLDIPFDLSKVFFIATANTTDTIPGPLLDRLEIIRLSGYTQNEKIAIANQYLIPRNIKEHGLSTSHLAIPSDTLEKLIDEYTAEAGVRNLDRLTAQLARKAAFELAHQVSKQITVFEAQKSKAQAQALKKAASKKPLAKKSTADAKNADTTPNPGTTPPVPTNENQTPTTVEPAGTTAGVVAGTLRQHPEFERIIKDLKFRKTIKPLQLKELLGVSHKLNRKKPAQVGVMTGLAWTQGGGDVLYIETSRLPGTGELKITGQLGEVMKESVQISSSYIKGRAKFLKLEYPGKEESLHIHFPAGATPKDGPSAGITICMALYSLLKGVKPKPTVAMTGEISLLGTVLPVGGIKEKLLAAKRLGYSTVLLPADNKADVEEFEKEITTGMTLHFVKSFDDALKYVF